MEVAVSTNNLHIFIVIIKILSKTDLQKIFCVIVYWLIELQSGAGRFIFFLLNLYAVELIGFSFIVFISAITPSSVFAGTLVPAVELLFTLSAGFLIPANQIPGWWVSLKSFFLFLFYCFCQDLLQNERYGYTGRHHCTMRLKDY